MSQLWIMPVEVAAVLSDTGHMTADEFGSYCRLLFTMWQHGGRLKNNRHELARIAGVTVDQWKIIRKRVMRPMTVSGGYVSQKRLTDTWIRVQNKRAKLAIAAQSRWSKTDKPLKTNEMPDANAFQMHMHRDANQNQNKNLSSLPSAGRPISAKDLHELTREKTQQRFKFGPEGDVKRRDVR